LSDQSQILFTELNLSRPFLRAIEAMGYTNPTPVQAQVIPYALGGRDICASAVTGSGKTAAFVLPFLERLLYRPKDIHTIRVLIITPTRELALQIHEVLVKLAQYTDISCCLICGGKKDVRQQEATLRAFPDVVICTPGRMLDHLRNSHSIHLDDLDVLVLDEVDRLLELGFQEELEELLKYCPHQRQTMLFSATMTPRVEDLVKLSLKRPIRIKTAQSNSEIAPRLIQEFVKVRSADDMESILLALVQRTFHNRTIIFFEFKKTAHKFCAMLNISGIPTVELHGNLPQTQRYLNLENFRTGKVDVLVATDVAARGIDIPGVQTVINAEMPRNISMYVHRVGRTARAGCGGRAITLVTDDRRKIMKEVLKVEAKKQQQINEQFSKTPELAPHRQILARNIPAPVITHYTNKIASLQKELHAHFIEERAKFQLERMERETDQAENLIQHAEEIAARPARTWFLSTYDKQQHKEKVQDLIKKENEFAATEDPKAKHPRYRTADDELKEKHRDEILAGPYSDKQKQALLAIHDDDYRIDDKEMKKLVGNPEKHRMSRRKRRRLEALQDIEGGDDNNHEDEDGGKKESFHFVPQKAKAMLREKQQLHAEKSAGELAMKKITIIEDEHRFKRPNTGEEYDHDGDFDQEGKIQGKKKIKVVRQKFAVGGLDQDAFNMGTSGYAGMSKKQIKMAAKEKPFTDFDPNKRLRKGGKGGKVNFKSKSKFKRRK